MKNTRINRLTQERLFEVLRYDPETGNFWWIKKTGPASRLDKPAGGLDKNGYVKIGLDGVQQYAHRLAMFYMTGNFSQEVDHKDLNKSNNKWDNLRPALPFQQMQNKSIPSSNTSGMKGIRMEGSGWRVRVRAGGKKLHIGIFKTPEEAMKAYTEAIMKYHGDFGRVA